MTRNIPTLGYESKSAAALALRDQGKSPREIQRCLKRHLARRLFKLLESVAELRSSGPEIAA